MNHKMKRQRFNSYLGVILIVLICCFGGLAQTLSPNSPHSSRADSNLIRVGNWPFGPALAVAVDTPRNLAYVGSGAAVLVLDVTDLENPQLVSDDINTLGLVLDLRYNHSTGNLYVAANYEDFQIWNVQNPEAPQRLSQYELPDPYADPPPPVGHVEFLGDYAILECAFDFVNSINISNPAFPFLVDADATMGNPARDIHVASDGRLHTVGGQAYVGYNIQSGGNLNPVAFYDGFIAGANLVFGRGEYGFIRYRDFLVILEPGELFPVLSSTQVGYFKDIVVHGNHAYLTINDELRIYDISDLYNPFLTGCIAIPGYAEKLEVVGHHAYLAGGYGGLRIINVEDPTQPFATGSYQTFNAVREAYRSGKYGYAAAYDDGMLVLDLSSISDPVFIGQYDTPGITVDLKVSGHFSYVADGEGGLRIADISNPAAPVEMGAYDSLYATVVSISGNYAYVVDTQINGPDRIRIIDISNPAAPTEAGSIQMQSSIDELDVSGSYLYAAANDMGMRVLDISNPNNPLEVGSYAVPNVYDVIVRGDYAYLASADWDGGFLILDVSNPPSPALVSSYNPGGWLHPFDIAVSGDYAYLGQPTGADLFLLYIGDPDNPSELGRFRTSGNMFELFALDSLIYISDGAAGLQILENSLFSTPGAGITWQPQSSGTTEDLWSTHFANSTTGWAVGHDGVIVRTTNGGQTWLQKASGTTSELFSVFFIDQNTGWAAGRDGTIIKSTDGGESWQPLISGTTDVFRCIQFIDNDTGWAVGENGMIRHTTDGGATWQPQASGTSNYLRQVYFTDGLHGWVTRDDGVILKTTDGGSNWNSVYVPTPANIYDVYFLNQNVGWAATSDVEVFKSIDGGNTWFLQYINPQSPYDVITSIYFIDENYGWAVGDEGKVISTTDGGNNWTEQTSGVLEYLTSVHFVDQNTGWTVGKEGTILKSTSGVTSIGNDGIRPKNLPGKVILYNNFPNPFNPTTTIRYDLPKTARISLKVYSILGETIRTLVDDIQPAGSKSVMWDGKNDQGKIVSSGVYIYQLNGVGAVKTKKMIFLK